MNRSRSACFVVVLALAMVQSAPAALVSNGSFETGDFTGWITTDNPVPLWPLSVQTAGSANTFGWPWSSTPTDGTYVAFSGFDGGEPGTISIAQDVGVVTDATDTLTFDYRAAWDLANFCDGCTGRSFDVIVEPAGGGAPLATFNFITATPETIVLDTGALSGIVDLSPFVGTDIRVTFALTVPESFTGPAQWQLDNVTLVAEAVPEPGSLSLLGLSLAGLAALRRRKTS